jgi:hypothetical protein
MKTAVEWYAEQAMQLEIQRGKGIISISQMLNELSNIFQQAKEMEKQNIIESYCQGCFDMWKDNGIVPRETGEDYYNENYKSE